MARIRSIKPEFFTSEAVAALEFRQMILWQGLWCHQDDKGRCRDNPKLIKSQVFPLRDDVDPEMVEADLKVLADEGRIVRYQIDGRGYIATINFDEHQKPSKPQPAKFPPPPGSGSPGRPRTPQAELFPEPSRNNSGAVPERSRDGDETAPARLAGALPEDSHVDGETEGLVGEGRGSRGHARGRARGAAAEDQDTPHPKKSKNNTPPNARSEMLDPENNGPCRRHPDDDRNCSHCADIRRNRPAGYDPRPAELIPDDQLDVDSWADPPEDLVPPFDVEIDDDPAARRRWYATARADQLTARRAQARSNLAAYQARHP